MECEPTDQNQGLRPGEKVLKCWFDFYSDSLTFFPGCQMVASVSSTSTFFRKYFLEKIKNAVEKEIPFTTSGVLIGIFYFFYHHKKIPTTLGGRDLCGATNYLLRQDGEKGLKIFQNIREKNCARGFWRRESLRILFNPIEHIFACLCWKCVSRTPL